MSRRMIAPLAFGVIGFAVLIALGVWQVQRLEWKTAILATIAERRAAEPGPLPADPDEAAHEYLRVRVAGEVEPGELHVYTSAPPWGVGYRIVAPFRLDDGRRILLDRGFVPIGDKDAPRRLGRLVVDGTLLWPDETDAFTSAPDRTRNIWLARDAAAMAEALGVEPVMVVTETTDDASGPMPLPVGLNIRNDHLGYAVTWFGLAGVWGVMTGFLLWRITRST